MPYEPAYIPLAIPCKCLNFLSKYFYMTRFWKSDNEETWPKYRLIYTLITRSLQWGISFPRRVMTDFGGYKCESSDEKLLRDVDSCERLWTRERAIDALVPYPNGRTDRALSTVSPSGCHLQARKPAAAAGRWSMPAFGRDISRLSVTRLMLLAETNLTTAQFRRHCWTDVDLQLKLNNIFIVTLRLHKQWK